MSELNECWANVKGFDGCYSVSTKGRIRSEPRVSAHGRRLSGRILRQTKGKVSLWGSKGENEYMLVTRAVVDAFIGWPTDDKYLRYIDGDSNNNSVDNLIFCEKPEVELNGTYNLYKLIISTLKENHKDVYSEIISNINNNEPAIDNSSLSLKAKHGVNGVANTLKEGGRVNKSVTTEINSIGFGLFRDGQ